MANCLTFAGPLQKIHINNSPHLGLDPECLQDFMLGRTDEEPADDFDRFIERIGGIYLTSIVMQEVKS